jgi:LysM domain
MGTSSSARLASGGVRIKHVFGFRLTTERPFEILTLVKRTRVRWRRVGALALAVAIPFGAKAAAASSGHDAGPGRTYVVRPGDTLWAIASRIAGPNGDPRPVVDQLEQVNHTSGVIVPGESLRLP